MPDPIQGIHHITAIASDPQCNLDFYTQVLGLRLVKLTVNFDDPGTYHFYFADEAGHPGSILTFFPWVGTRRGRRGLGQVGVVAFTIPADSIGYWTERLKKMGTSTSAPFQRFNEQVLTILDPDGLPIDLVAKDGLAAGPGWKGSPIPPEQAIRGFAGPTLLLGEPSGTIELLSTVFGLKPVQQEGPRYRFTADPGMGGQVDIEVRTGEAPGQMGAGIVHHMAWRAPNDQQQLEWRQILVDKGFNVTPVIDRMYFHSIYFREPGGILFEIATDPPGFATDETLETLGTTLKIPAWLETQRGEIEQSLPKVKLPTEMTSTSSSD